MFMFYGQIVLSTMPPKHKAQNPPKDAKLVKKGCQMKIEDSSSYKDNDDITKENSTGKNKGGDREEKNVCSSMKMETSSPDLLDENQNTNKADFPNLELNQLLQKYQSSTFRVQ